ncbi:MAG: bifunctional phosphopantothenoylcysteine decarboxylase/phosphopantothenate--cysteine ligase CoaBC [Bacteroidetes bacterium]|nr:bifunctional phosphopantothenoylcysteine decarboxylase/phosphopantothenate--cysteine ligase CoaBC [Bacteroidota bacterium]
MNLILGISGSIAAYKSAFLTRLFVKSGHEVQILMTQAATGFITPLTLSTLSQRPVFTDVHSESGWNNHVELGLWGHALLIAPASANTLAKLANGICDNILCAVYLSARCPVFLAPAMDVDMWHHPATQSNIQKLKQFGVQIIPVGHGALASGLVGDGRMAEPEEIVQFLENHFRQTRDLDGQKILVTAGPTQENIDPVRFISNHSSGKMGIAIADELAHRGASVVLVLGPTHLRPQHAGVKTIPVHTAQEMFDACQIHFPSANKAILAAAVADYKPKTVASKKIKKSEAEMNIELDKTIDIAASLGRLKQTGQHIIGFALETDQELEHAQIKLQRKNFDFIVLNSLNDPGAGFGHDTNKVTLLFRNGQIKPFPLATKTEVARILVDEIVQL